MNNWPRKPLLLLTVLAMTSCATINRYQEPVAGPAATVTIQTLDARHLNIGVVSYRGTEYLESKGDVVAVLNSKAIGHEFTDRVTIRVAAGQPFRFSTKVGEVVGAGPGKVQGIACQTHSRFYPEAGLTYLIEHSPTEGGCTVALSRLDSTGNKTPDPSLKQLKSCLDPWLTGNAFSDDYCKEGFSYE